MCLGIHDLDEVHLGSGRLTEELIGPYGVDVGMVDFDVGVPKILRQLRSGQICTAKGTSTTPKFLQEKKFLRYPSIYYHLYSSVGWCIALSKLFLVAFKSNR